MPPRIPIKIISIMVSTMSGKWVQLTERKSSFSCDEFMHEISSLLIEIIVRAILGWEDSPTSVNYFPLYNFILLESHTSGCKRSIKASSSLLGKYLKTAFSPYLEGLQFSKDSFWCCRHALFLLFVCEEFGGGTNQRLTFGPINLWYFYSILRTMIHLQ